MYVNVSEHFFKAERVKWNYTHQIERNGYVWNVVAVCTYYNLVMLYEVWKFLGSQDSLLHNF